VRQTTNYAFYLQALPLYARNLGVLLAPLAAAAINLGLQYLSAWIFEAVGDAGAFIFQLVGQVVLGFGFAVAVIFADDAWRHGRGNLRTAWEQARRRAGDIFIAVIGFYFLIYVAALIGGIIGGILRVPYIIQVMQALAVWAFAYSIPAAAIGGIPGGAVFSAALQAAKRHVVATIVLVVVSLVVYWGLTIYALAAIGAYLGTGYDAASILLTAVAWGYIALIAARQYSDFAFRPYW
jgi:hypothetical protein